MPSPYSTGGGGTHFEARVAAAYLAAVLCEAPARGLPGQQAKAVRTQTAAHGEPLDDIVVEGSFADGRATKLSLQVKSEVRFTSNDPEWVAVVQAAWDTFAQPDFDVALHRVGLAIANYDAKIDKYYQSVLTWATHSADAADFFQRIGKRDFSHAEKRNLVEAIQTILTAYLGRAVAADELWRFLRSFVILHFDLNCQTARNRDPLSAPKRDPFSLSSSGEARSPQRAQRVAAG